MVSQEPFKRPGTSKDPSVIEGVASAVVNLDDIDITLSGVPSDKGKNEKGSAVVEHSKIGDVPKEATKEQSNLEVPKEKLKEKPKEKSKEEIKVEKPKEEKKIPVGKPKLDVRATETSDKPKPKQETRNFPNNATESSVSIPGDSPGAIKIPAPNTLKSNIFEEEKRNHPKS